jgi:UDP-sugar transporter A1/2/3
MTMEWRTSIKYTVPSILYLLCNNLALEALRYLKPATYQILGNLRIVTTGLLTVLLLRRPLARIQWVALVLMTVGAATSQLGMYALPSPSLSWR